MRTSLKVIPLAASVLLTAPGAGAVVNPRYFREAREAAPNVVTLEVQAVKAPLWLRGDCMVSGKVAEVERGGRYRPGQPLTLKVACGRSVGLTPLGGGGVAHAVADLKKAKRGKAWLDDRGEVMQSQYRTLDPHTPTWADKSDRGEN